MPINTDLSQNQNTDPNTTCSRKHRKHYHCSWSWEMEQRLRVQATDLSKDPGSILNSHMTAHSHLQLQFQGINPILACIQVVSAQTHMQANSHINLQTMVSAWYTTCLKATKPIPRASLGSYLIHQASDPIFTTWSQPNQSKPTYSI